MLSTLNFYFFCFFKICYAKRFEPKDDGKITIEYGCKKKKDCWASSESAEDNDGDAIQDGDNNDQVKRRKRGTYKNIRKRRKRENEDGNGTGGDSEGDGEKKWIDHSSNKDENKDLEFDAGGCCWQDYCNEFNGDKIELVEEPVELKLPECEKGGFTG